MNKKTRRITLTAVLMLFAACLTGCAQLDQLQELIPQLSQEEAWEPDRTAVTDEDGVIHETVMEALDQEWYSQSELEEMLSSSVDEYNRENGADAVTVDNFEVNEGQVVLTMTYRCAADYAAFNQVEFYQGSMLGAQMEGFLFDTDFHKVERGRIKEEGVSASEPLSHKESQVLITQQPHVVCVPGRITYISGNGTLLGKQIAEPASGTADGAEAPTAGTDSAEASAAEGDGAETSTEGAGGAEASAAEEGSAQTSAEGADGAQTQTQTKTEKNLFYVIYEF